MFRKILLPVDRSEKHGPALKIAAELASQSGGEVSLLHVVELIAGVALEEDKSFYTRLEKLARAHLEQLGKQLGAANVAWRQEVVFGNRGMEIIRSAQGMSSDLIVLTAPRLDPTNLAEGWGSLSYKVSVAAPCPILLVK